MSLPQRIQPSLDERVARLKRLKTTFRQHVRAGEDDLAAPLASTLLCVATTVARITNKLSPGSEADSLMFFEAQQAADLLKLIPATGQGEGMPQTKEKLWPYIISGMAMGSSLTEELARLLLRPKRLSRSEQAALKRCFQRTLEAHGELWPMSLITALHCVTRRSEPCATRCIMHAVARYATDEQLMRLYS